MRFPFFRRRTQCELILRRHAINGAVPDDVHRQAKELERLYHLFTDDIDPDEVNAATFYFINRPSLPRLCTAGALALLDTLKATTCRRIVDIEYSLQIAHINFCGEPPRQIFIYSSRKTTFGALAVQFLHTREAKPEEYAEEYAALANMIACIEYLREIGKLHISTYHSNIISRMFAAVKEP